MENSWVLALTCIVNPPCDICCTEELRRTFNFSTCPLRTAHIRTYLKLYGGIFHSDEMWHILLSATWRDVISVAEWRRQKLWRERVFTRQLIRPVMSLVFYSVHDGVVLHYSSCITFGACKIGVPSAMCRAATVRWYTHWHGLGFVRSLRFVSGASASMNRDFLDPTTLALDDVRPANDYARSHTLGPLKTVPKEGVSLCLIFCVTTHKLCLCRACLTVWFVLQDCVLLCHIVNVGVPLLQFTCPHSTCISRLASTILVPFHAIFWIFRVCTTWFKLHLCVWIELTQDNFLRKMKLLAILTSTTWDIIACRRLPDAFGVLMF